MEWKLEDFLVAKRVEVSDDSMDCRMETKLRTQKELKMEQRMVV